MIPKFGPTSGYLPRGVHVASWQEVVEVLGFSEKRKDLLEGLLRMATALRTAGASTMILDGSFVSKKHSPSDYDCCYDQRTVDMKLLDPVLDEFSNERAAQKSKYKGELFPAHAIADLISWEPFEAFFQHDKNGRRKGVILLQLDTLP